MNEQLKKRLKSLAWRAGMMGVAAAVAAVADGVAGLGLSPAIVGILGLVLGEVSKQLNSKAK
ncbi:hypothetical protein IID22_02090 [Patescibacteria group bacterium]|nr:hypothetical protein [Patescibacteria group bacterium]